MFPPGSVEKQINLTHI